MSRAYHTFLPVAAPAGPERWRAYHGIVLYLLVQIVGAGLGRLASTAQATRRPTDGAQQAYFRELRQVRFAPPAWVFVPVWIVNNLTSLWGLLRVLNQPGTTPGRRAFLALQAGAWLDLTIWQAAYFASRSPINGLVLTFLYLVITLASMGLALFRLRDRQVALSLVTLLAWLLLATPLAVFQVLWNRDDLYGTGPFLTPDPRWVKPGTGDGAGAGTQPE